jgi:hypothetical protein
MPSLITVDQLKSRLRIPAAVTEFDSHLGELIDEAEEEILSEASFTAFASTTYSEKHDVDWDGVNELRLKNNFLVSVVALTNNGTALVEGTDFYKTEHSYIRLIGDSSFFVRGRQTIDVTYVAGPCGSHVTGTTPADLRKLAGLIAARDFNLSPKAGFSSEKIGQYAFSAGSGGGAATAVGGSGVLNDAAEREIENLKARYRRAFAHTSANG